MERATSRLKVLALLVALMFLALTARLWFLQVLATDTFRAEARNNSVRFVYSDALRGRMLAHCDPELTCPNLASGAPVPKGWVPIVENQTSLEVRVVPTKLQESGQAEEVVTRLADLLSGYGITAEDITRSLQDPKYYPYQPKPIAEFVGLRVNAAIKDHQDLFPGVTVVPTSVRSYPMGRFAAHVLGYVGQIQGDELDDPKYKDYGQSDLVGRAGLEQVYEKELRGTKGVQKLVVNSDGETIRAGAEVKPQQGNDLYLALDADIQTAAEEELRAGMLRAQSFSDSENHPLVADGGAVVVLDANTGSVRAMASVPSYDPSWFVHGLTKMEQSYLFESPLGPSNNRATGELGYYPGSTFKAITALVALKEGVASLSGTYYCSTDYSHPGDDSGAVFHNWSSSDSYMSIASALEHSCDTIFYRWGSDFYRIWAADPLGADAEPMQRDLREWGFGSPTGIDLPAEGSGRVPDAAWAESRHDLFPFGWVPGGDILTMIGSSYITATPLQLATAYAAIANGGHLCRPHLVEEVRDTDGKLVETIPTKCERTLPYSSQQLAYIRAALASVVSGGTAACAFSGFPLTQVPVAGKTGTAETPGKQDTSWFAAMVPANDPKYVIVAMVEQGGFGSQTAAPIVRHIIERMYGLPKQTPDPCQED
jgi:penicillin-binding protein 2